MNIDAPDKTQLEMIRARIDAYLAQYPKNSGSYTHSFSNFKRELREGVVWFSHGWGWRVRIGWEAEWQRKYDAAPAPEFSSDFVAKAWILDDIKKYGPQSYVDWEADIRFAAATSDADLEQVLHIDYYEMDKVRGRGIPASVKRRRTLIRKLKESRFLEPYIENGVKLFRIREQP